MSDTPRARPLGPLERWYHLADSFAPLNSIAHARVSGLRSPESLVSALPCLRERHPSLRVRVAEAEGGLHFFPACAPIRVQVSESGALDDAAWAARVNQDELGHRHDGAEGPLARAAVIARRDGSLDAVLNVSHLICDGRSVLSALWDWIRFAEHFDSHGRLPDVESLPSRPAPEAMFPPGYGGTAGLARVLGYGLRDAWGDTWQGTRPLTTEHGVPSEGRRTEFFPVSLASEDMSRLRSACKAHDVTVHGLLAAALARALREVDGFSAPTVRMGSPVDFRSSLDGLSDDEMGAFVTTLASRVPTMGSLWEVARGVGSELDTRKRRDEPMRVLSALHWFAPKNRENSGRFLGFLDARGPGTLCLSNMGRMPFATRIGSVHAEQWSAVGSLSVFSSLLLAATTSGGALHVNVAFVPARLPEARARAIADRFVSLLRSHGDA